MTPAERTLRARIAAHSSWANTPDRTARARKAVDATLARFERQVDPEGHFSPAQRRQMAESARRAHMARLSARAAQARKEKRHG